MCSHWSFHVKLALRSASRRSALPELPPLLAPRDTPMTSPKPQPGRWYPLDASRHVYPGFIHLNYLFGQELAVWCSSSGQVHVWECRPPGAADDVRPGLSVDDDDVVYRYLGCRGRSTDRGAELMLNALGP